MNIFLDSSALVKLYIREDGTGRIIELCKAADEIAVSVICIAELLSACNRLVREGLVTADIYSSIKRQFLADIGTAVVIDLTAEVLEYSIACLEKGSLRTLDAIHIGAALVYKAGIFVTADVKQKNLAVIMGLNTELI